MLLLMLSFLAPATDAPPEAQKYLQRCEAAKTVDIAAKEALLKSLAGEKLKLASAEVAKLKAAPARLLHLPLPPRKGELGTFAAAEELSGGKSVVVLEVVNKENAIVRAWYLPPDSKVPGEPTFVDVWIQGIDTRALSAGSPAVLTPVFQVTGNKLIDTTCGKRSFPLLEPVEIEKYRGQK